MRLSNGDVLMSWPLKKHVISAGWWYNSGILHRAIDFGDTPVGTPVYAAEDGMVSICYHWNGKVTQGNTNSYGNMVKLSHDAYKGGSLETLYAHLSKIVVTKGQKVKEGDLIGYSGQTGNCYGPHLHFEVRYKYQRVHPLNWLDDDFTSKVPQNRLGSYVSVKRESVPTANRTMQLLTIGPVSSGDAMKFYDLANELGLVSTGLYKAEYQ